LASTRADLESALSRWTLLNDQHTATQQHLTTLTSQLETKAVELEDARTQLAAQATTLETIRTEKASLSIQNEDALRSASILTQQISTLESKLAGVQEENANLKDFEKRVQLAERERDSAKKQVEKVQAQLDRAEEKFHQLQEKARQASQTATSATTGRALNDRELKELQRKLAALERDNARLHEAERRAHEAELEKQAAEKHSDQLLKDTQRAKVASEKAMSDLALLAKELQEVRESRGCALADLVKARQQIAVFEKKILDDAHRVKILLDERQAQHDDTLRQVRALEARLEQAHVAEEELQRQTFVLQQERSSLKESCAAMEIKMKDQMADSQRVLASQEAATKDALAAQSSSYLAQVNTIQEEITALRSRTSEERALLLSGHAQELSQLQAELEKEKSTHAEDACSLGAELERLRVLHDELKSQCELDQTTISSLREALSKATSELAALSTSFDTTRTQLEGLEVQMSSLVNERNGLQETVQALLVEKSHLSEALVLSEANLARSTTACSFAQNTCVELSHRTSTIARLYVAMRDHVASSISSFESLLSSYKGQVVSSFKSLMNSKAEILSQCENFSRTVSEFKSSNLTLHATLTDTRAEKTRLETLCASQSEEISSLTAKVLMLETELTSMSAQKASLLAELGDMRSGRTEAETKLAECEGQILCSYVRKEEFDRSQMLCTELSRKHAEAEATTARVSQELEETRKQLLVALTEFDRTSRDSSVRLVELEDELRAAQARIGAEEAAFLRAQEEALQLNAQVQQLARTKAQLDQQKRDLELKLEQMTETNRLSSSSQTGIVQDELERLRSQNAAMASQIAEVRVLYESRLTESDSTITDLQATLDASAEQTRAITEELEKITQQRRDLLAQRDSLATQLEEERRRPLFDAERNEQLLREVASLTRERAFLVRSLAEAHDAVAVVQKRSKHKESELANSLQVSRECEARAKQEAEVIKSKLNSIAIRLSQSSRGDEAKMSAEIAGLKTQLQQSSRRIRELEERRASLESEMLRLQDELIQTQHHLRTQEALHANELANSRESESRRTPTIIEPPTSFPHSTELSPISLASSPGVSASAHPLSPLSTPSLEVSQPPRVTFIPSDADKENALPGDAQGKVPLNPLSKRKALQPR